MLLERLDGREQELAAGRAGHGAEAFAGNVFLGHGLAVKRGELGFVIEQIGVRGRAILEEIDHAFRFWRVMWETGQSGHLRGAGCGGGRGPQVAGEE